MMTFNDFIYNSKLKNKAISNINIQIILSSLSLIDVGIFLRDGTFPSDVGIVDLQASNGTHWVVYNNEIFFDSYGCVPPNELFKIIIKRIEHCLFSENLKKKHKI